MYQLGGITPVREHCTSTEVGITPLSGVTPLRNKLECGQLLLEAGCVGLWVCASWFQAVAFAKP